MTDTPLLPYACPRCGGQFRVDPSQAGEQVHCPHCQTVVALGETPRGGGGPAASPPTATGEALSLNCPVCHGLFRTARETAGQQVLCPHCQQRVAVPDVGASQPAAGSPDAASPPSGPTPTGPPPVPPASDAGLAAPTPPGPGPETRAESPSPSWPPPLPPAGTGEVQISVPDSQPAAGQPATAGDANPLGGVVIHDAPRTITRGGQVIELRSLTREERARQRKIKNIVMFLVGVAILGSYLLYHVGFWPFGR